ncbi:UNVERIFIED_CONTAM: hypothetical protein H355_010845 [Colinus virginianus]|nr:hypothetical protein H355_010845 [Colinus virginianus]
MVEAVDVLAGSTRAVSGGRDFRMKEYYCGTPDAPNQLLELESDIFALGDESGTVALVDTKNPDSALSSTVHARRVTGFAFSAHSSPLLASISEDCTVAVLNSDLSEVFRSRSHRDFVKGLSWSPSDNALLTTVGWDHQVLHHTVPIPTGEASGINCVKE